MLGGGFSLLPAFRSILDRFELVLPRLLRAPSQRWISTTWMMRSSRGMWVRFLLLLDVRVASGLGRRQHKTAGAVVSDAEAARISTSSFHMITQ